MSSTILPWVPSNVPGAITKELDRRKVNRSFNYINNATATWDVNGNFQNYRGPLTSWVRLCSNGKGHPDEKGEYNRRRFVLYGGKGFYQTYGFQPPATPSGEKYQIIGYTPGNSDGSNVIPHTIENSLNTPSDEPKNYPIHVSSPEISRIEVTIQKELFRRAEIEWICFSWKQLVYMAPYFLIPRITCMLEWGWNHYNINSLVNLGDVSSNPKGMRGLWDNAYPLYTDNIIDSCGNYDVIYGYITNFNWSIKGNKITVTTEITSKDRLYAGIVTDYGLSVKDTGNPTTKGGIFRSINDFFTNNKNTLNLQKIVTNDPIFDVNSLMSAVNNSSDQDPNGKDTWFDILKPIFVNSMGPYTPAQIGMRLPYVYGYFSGRPTNLPTTNQNSYVGNDWGPAAAGDFDYNTKVNSVGNRIWINMGMVVTILNSFSSLASGTNQGKNMFEVDIQNSIISGHPNLISCDPRVLIPNYQAPKFLYGAVGITDNAGLSTKGGMYQNKPASEIPYLNQALRPIPLASSNNNNSGSLQNQILKNVLYQLDGNVYRDDLDSIINYNRYRFVKQTSNQTGIVWTLNSYSFPAKENSEPLPVSPRGLAGGKLEKDFSGLLSNIYISFDTLKDVVTNDGKSISYYNVYEEILKILNDSSDGLWNLSLVDVEGVFTITDRNYVSKYALQKQGDVVYSFDYYDADSIIKALSFKPTLSDAQATRAIFGSINNPNAKYSFIDKNDLLDYHFQDDVITPSEPEGDKSGELYTRTTANNQQRDLLRLVQQINNDSGDPALQMSLNANRIGTTSTTLKSSPLGSLSFNSKTGVVNSLEIIKLVLPNRQLLSMLLNDLDFDNNPRFCAVQPGIILELTIEGIGGLRTFQYFLVKNLPEPYSDKNIIWRITDITQTLEIGTWETVIRAQPLPLRGYIKNKLTGPLGISSGKNGWSD